MRQKKKKRTKEKNKRAPAMLDSGGVVVVQCFKKIFFLEQKEKASRNEKVGAQHSSYNEGKKGIKK